ncbi:MAG TPA: S8 family serine peptidase, partial [Geobacteraceae bacterium]|nr:S8 family serine peptidase [Geobacteraceae bacterium]
YPESFGVGAVNQLLAIAPFSSRGPSACGGAIFPAMTAPGVNIRVADLSFDGMNSYTSLSGTSFAAPHVAGAMALLLSAFPALSEPELEAALSSSATDLGTAGPDNDYGRGLLNVLASYKGLLVISVAPASHDYGTVNVGSAPLPQTFSITNRSSADLTLAPVTISGSDSSYFTVGNDGCSGSTLVPEELCTLDVAYNPLSEGPKDADLVVSYNDPAAYSLSVPLHGSTFAAVTLLAPNGGEAIPSGSHFPIRWGAPAAAIKFNLAYSVDNGWTWLPIAAGVTGTDYDWPVPTPIANRVKTLVRVTGFNSKGKMVGRDRSDAPSVIEVVMLTSPNGGESLTSGEFKTITWTNNATKREVASVRLWYTLNGGLTWLPVISPVDNTGSYAWKIPAVPAAKYKCRVRVVLRDAAGFAVGNDISDDYFSIQPAP